MAGRADQPLTIHMAVEVTGERDPDAIYVDFYASADTQITESDFYLGQVSLALSMNSWTMVTLYCTLPEDDDLRPGRGSPCIDAGDADAIPKDAIDLDGDGDILEPLPLDRGGNPRVTGDAVDIGAYEAQPPANHAS